MTATLKGYYKIKSLEWDDESYPTSASSLAGEYEIRIFGDTTGYDEAKVRDGKICVLFINDHTRSGGWGSWGSELTDAATIDEAKLAAAIHYYEQLSKVLVSVDPATSEGN